jgi:hypothetical protein
MADRSAVLLFLPFGRIFGDGVSFRLRSQFPEEPSTVSVDWWPKPHERHIIMIRLFKLVVNGMVNPTTIIIILIR